MPTLHVRPEDGEPLQIIADAIAKAKKVVVVTGAGISTNSGIPDFRSENGLYQLIQTQYDAAAKAATESPDEPPKPANGGTRDGASNPQDFPDDRPCKRRKLSLADREASNTSSNETRTPAAGPGKPDDSAASGSHGRVKREEPQDEASRTDNLSHIVAKAEGCADSNSAQAITLTTPGTGPTLNAVPEGERKKLADHQEPRQLQANKDPYEPGSASGQGRESPGPADPLPQRPDPPPLLQKSRSHDERITSPAVNKGSFHHHHASPPVEQAEQPGQVCCDSTDSVSTQSDVVCAKSSILVSVNTEELTLPPPSRSPPSNSVALGSPSAHPATPTRHSVVPSHHVNVSVALAPLNTHKARFLAAHPLSSSPLSDLPLYPSSSPLSSPPSVLFDPLHQDSPHQDHQLSSSTSSPSETGETPPSNPSTAPSSFASLTSSSRLPFPNLKGRDLFDASIWSCPVRTSVFYTFATSLRRKTQDVSPTPSHYFIGHLRDRGKLVRCYTQNIDRIEEKVGLSTCLDRGPGHRSRFSRRRSTPLAKRNSSVSRSSDDSAVNGGTSAPLSSRPPASGPGRGGDSTCDPDAPVQSTGGPAHQRANGRGDNKDTQSSTDTLLEPATTASRIAGDRNSDIDIPSQVPTCAPDKGGHAQADAALSKRPSQISEGASARSGADSGPAGECPSSMSANCAPSTRDAETRVEGPAAESSGASNVRKQSEGGEDTPLSSEDAGRKEIVVATKEPSATTQAGSNSVPPSQQRRRQTSPSSGVECVFLHGSLESLRCFLCRKLCEWDGDDRERETLSGRQPECPHCAGATAAREERGKRALAVGKLRPDIVLYGEEHPSAHLISPIVTHDLGLGPDMLLILGTSLKVHGLKVLVRQFAKAVHSRGGKVVFINFTKPPESSWGDVIDYWIEWDCDAWVNNLKERAPVLWLPPGATLPAQPKKRKRGSLEKKKRGTKKAGSAQLIKESGDAVVKGGDDTACRKAAPSNDSGIVAKPDRSIAVANEVVTAQKPKSDVASALASTEKKPEPKPRAPRARALRDDKANGAYLSWKIMDALRSVSGRPAPPSMKLPSVEATRAIIAAEAKSKRLEAKARRQLRLSAPAALSRNAPGAESESDKIRIKGQKKGSRKDSKKGDRMGNAKCDRNDAAPAAFSRYLPALRPNEPPLSSPMLAPPASYSFSVFTPLATSQSPAAYSQGSSHPPLPALSSPSIANEQNQEQPATGPILAAVKSNARKRIRKMIDGQEVVLPCVSSRGAFKQRPGALTPGSRRTPAPPTRPPGKENMVPFGSKEQVLPPLLPMPKPMPPPTQPSTPSSVQFPHLDNGLYSISLPPLREPITPRKRQQQRCNEPRSSPSAGGCGGRHTKPEPLEPLSSPMGPLTSVSANLRAVGGRRGRGEERRERAQGVFGNPFWLYDPSVRW